MGILARPKKKINKLFLVGNGLDIALRLKTRYNDFILWLLKKFITEASLSNIEVVPKIYRKKVFGFSSNGLFDILINENYNKIIPNCIESNDTLNKLFQYCKTYNIEIKPKNTMGLFERILKSSELDWVDIEGRYFELIKFILKNPRLTINIDSINEEMDYLKKFLFEYLSEIKISIDEKKRKEYLNQFNDDIELENFSFINSRRPFNKKSTLDEPINYFLNFNYTDSVFNLLSKSNKKYTINHIHGDLKKDHESIIFGFGDEMDKVYKEIEELNDNRFFKHIKSFQYFKSKKYRELLTFLETDYFQVCIYGHSCGLSDRIMLNEIFEHKNCISIKIYYRDKSDYETKTMEISRHFNSNKEMRRKILDFDTNCRIPQVNE